MSITSSRFNWKENKLYLGTEYVGEIFIDDHDLYRIRFSDGEVSSDYYNKTRAKDNLIKSVTREKNAHLLSAKNNSAGGSP